MGLKVISSAMLLPYYEWHGMLVDGYLSMTDLKWFAMAKKHLDLNQNIIIVFGGMQLHRCQILISAQQSNPVTRISCKCT